MQLYTIGHSTIPQTHFLELLQQYQVQYVLDVRSTPYSKYAIQYNREEVEAFLKKNNIKYFHMGKFFGARQENPKYYHPEGYLDFELFRESDVFKAGVENVIKGLKNNNIALMCTEKDPIDCHRAIMVARGFELEGIDVKHILHDFSFISQDELNERLLDKYFPDRNQLTIFSLGEVKTKEEYLIEAYRKRNSEIGYRLKDNTEGKME